MNERSAGDGRMAGSDSATGMGEPRQPYAGDSLIRLGRGLCRGDALVSAVALEARRCGLRPGDLLDAQFSLGGVD